MGRSLSFWMGFGWDVLADIRQERTISPLIYMGEVFN
jgi:hypothetical protein